ncbi:sulfite exporter TauE/SafE family protein [Qipengyuania flava]|uniref:sulfite exporter TauE/SafE family protein n=1 Tax=Qipengyuania flava TaxID=192812 RepID=UPI001C566682|nr:sulfite exporter TauE/SafE family protein [Qipengyuania flava]MBW3167063.1 sulfite exporter TauE/SafE family protein [Qipengyuania flava]MBY5964301.1 sulfite exporter TauE/SafE family protein [Qipengyuania flava]MBY6010625.1 sulfite exporter TauE/SafE family protein [Qipengyuania flava]MBY6025067.1 sulfite exporter TauE/SafE family protein [Qipengyuania flava]
MELLAAYAPWQIAAALGAALGSAFVRGLTGFGMAILLVPILALALPPVESVLLANFLSLFIGLTEVRRLVRGAERSAWRVSLLVVLFTPLGLLALAATSDDLARFLIAMIALSAFFAILLPRRAGTEPGHLATGGVGVLSGLMTGYAGMPGPPVVPYYVGRDIPRETAKASMMLIFTIASFAGLVSSAALGILAWRLPLVAAVLFPAVLIGNALGDRASGRIGDRLWRSAVGVILGGAALAALLRLV